MNDSETQAWRENVAITLAEIKAQLGRLASDRESEKETMLRVTTELHAEDRRILERLDRHIEWNDTEHEKNRDKVTKISGRVNFFTGVILTLQFIVTLSVGVIALLK